MIFFLLPVFWFLESDWEDPVQWNIHFWHSLFDLHFYSSVATCSWVYKHKYKLNIWITRKHWLLWLYLIVHWEELCHRVGNHEDNLVFDIFLFLDEIAWVTEWVMFSDIASTELVISRSSAACLKCQQNLFFLCGRQWINFIFLLLQPVSSLSLSGG